MNELRTTSGNGLARSSRRFWTRPWADEREPDRTALLLRFFEHYDFQTVGRALGSSEDAARMRVTRALEKLEVLLKRRGVTARAAGLSGKTSAAGPAPAGLTLAISTATLAGTTATMATHTAMNLINTKTITALVAAALVAGTGTHLIHQREAINLRSENQNLMARTQALTAERDSVLAAARAGGDELEQSRKDRNELLRLRGEGWNAPQTNERASNAFSREQPAALALGGAPRCNRSTRTGTERRTPNLVHLCGRSGKATEQGCLDEWNELEDCHRSRSWLY